MQEVRTCFQGLRGAVQAKTFRLSIGSIGFLVLHEEYGHPTYGLRFVPRVSFVWSYRCPVSFCKAPLARLLDNLCDGHGLRDPAVSGNLIKTSRIKRIMVFFFTYIHVLAISTQEATCICTVALTETFFFDSRSMTSLHER